MNILIEGLICPNCFNKVDKSNGEIFTDKFTFDYSKRELFCNKCGLVCKDSMLPTITHLEYLVEREEIYKPLKTEETEEKPITLKPLLDEIAKEIEMIKKQKREERKKRKKKKSK